MYIICLFPVLGFSDNQQLNQKYVGSGIPYNMTPQAGFSLEGVLLAWVS